MNDKGNFMITYNIELERMERKIAIPGGKMTEKNFEIT